MSLGFHILPLSVRVVNPDTNTVVFGRELFKVFTNDIISSAHLVYVSFPLRLLGPTCTISLSGFFRRIGFIWSFMSNVVQPGKFALWPFS